MARIEASAERTTHDQALIENFFRDDVRALDDRRFAEWLALFSDDAFYGIIRHEDDRRDDHLFVLGESMDKLRARVGMGADLDQEMQVHLLSAIRLDEAAGEVIKASANFVVIKDARITYAGQYRAELHCLAGGVPRIRRLIAVITNDRPAELLYLPI